MRRAYAPAAVRGAEAVLIAQLPASTLMHRAAAGLAATCVRLLGGAYGRRVDLLVGSGDNGGDALFAGALLAARGAQVHALLLSD
ncbi:MAG: bifunctional ADP-dependent NAD(P)H-hydrate dehydratase/NAD(P)H-hydrate epimerase, partial [Actinomycetota bacterium]|nr:bifunctional ADP-dependent NAD(P)H-hydrate dehydratase/NAD(P)H-hydrate epimerase [Actinomycetota bacterium]